jgi:hypothetical protein
LFRLAGSDLPGMIKKREGNSTVIYSSSPGLSSELIRNIAAASGIRIFNEYQGDVSYVAKGLCSVHSLTGGKRRFNVPSDTVKVVEMITGKEVPVTGGVFEYELPAQSTSIFRIYNK